jgi:hypothetical protein
MVNLLQSVGAVIIGFLSLFFVQIGIGFAICRISLIFGFEHHPASNFVLVGNLVTRFATAIFPGWLCACASPSRPFVHAAFLAACYFVLNIEPPYILLHGSKIPFWYWRAEAIFVPLGILLGAIVYRRFDLAAFSHRIGRALARFYGPTKTAKKVRRTVGS